ncbi:MAG TPA: PQQ-binding-like beta-propeller repeat protein [Pirellulales bacterium]|jgi:outer membrane protein assembly factor BamB
MLLKLATRSAGLFLFAAIVLAHRLAAAADWPQWLGPHRDGATTEVVTPWSEVPQVVWRCEVGNGYSSPVVADGIVYVHSKTAAKKREAEDVLAFDATTGKAIWSDTYDRETYRSALGTGPRASPAVVDGKLYTFGITGVLTCYEAKSGKRLWQTNPYETYKSPLPRFGVCSSPVIAAGRVVVLVGGGGTAVTAYDSLTGEVAWKGLDEPAGSASPTVWMSGQGADARPTLVVQTTLRILGMKPEDGKVLWEHPLVFQPAGVSPTPFLIGNSLICTTPDTGTLSLEIPASAEVPPRLAWQKPQATSYFSTGTVGADSSVLIVTNQQAPVPRADLCCFDVANGDELWRKDGLGYYHFGVIATGDGKLLLLNDGGYLLLAEVTREGFRELAKSKVCRGTLCNPAFTDGKLYVRDDKELICLQLGRSTAASAPRE